MCSGCRCSQACGIFSTVDCETDDLGWLSDCLVICYMVSSLCFISTESYGLSQTCRGMMSEDYRDCENNAGLQQHDRYTYAVKPINPLKKWDFVVRKFRSESVFNCPKEIRLKMLATFPEFLSETTTFSLGYYSKAVATVKYISSNQGRCRKHLQNLLWSTTGNEFVVVPLLIIVKMQKIHLLPAAKGNRVQKKVMGASSSLDTWRG